MNSPGPVGPKPTGPTHPTPTGPDRPHWSTLAAGVALLLLLVVLPGLIGGRMADTPMPVPPTEPGPPPPTPPRPTG